MINLKYKLYLLKERLQGNFIRPESKNDRASSAQKNAVLKVLDIEFATAYLKTKTDHIPDFEGWEKLEQKVIKKRYGRYNTTCVIRYRLYYLNTEQQTQQVDFYFSASTDGTRYKSYQMMKLLREYGFNSGKYQVVEPVGYLEHQFCLVYIGAQGKNLYEYIVHTDKPVYDLVTVGARWLKRLHAININSIEHNLLTSNKIYQMLPRPSFASFWLTKVFDNWGVRAKNVFLRLFKLEDAFLNKLDKKYLVYGDFHPENLIFEDYQTKQLKMIDFTDLSIGDYHQDLGTFIQQLSFMSRLHLPADQIYKLKRVFLETYFEKEYKQIPQKHFDRINLYQAWTSMRSAVFIFFSHGSKSLVFELISDAEKYLQKIESHQKTVNIK